MRSQTFRFAAALAISLGTTTYCNADVIFTFADDGGNVTMTSSGSIDTSNLLFGPHGGWGGTTAYTHASGYSLIGSTAGSIGFTNQAYTFHAGTDFTPWLGATFSSTETSFVDSGTTPFSTYGHTGVVPGLMINTSDLVGTIWTPDNSWTRPGTLADLGWNLGTFTVSDAVNGESITFQVGTAAVPEPATLVFLSLGLVAVGVLRSRRQVLTAS